MQGHPEVSGGLSRSRVPAAEGCSLQKQGGQQGRGCRMQTHADSAGSRGPKAATFPGHHTPSVSRSLRKPEKKVAGTPPPAAGCLSRLSLQTCQHVPHAASLSGGAQIPERACACGHTAAHSQSSTQTAQTREVETSPPCFRVVLALVTPLGACGLCTWEEAAL